MNKVLVIVVTYNAMQWVDRCLNSIFSSSIPLDVYVVDNGSIDGSQDYIKSFGEKVEFYQSKQNLGFGRANNIGLQYALDNHYSYVYLLNQDAWVMPDTIEKLIRVHQNNPLYGILSPFQLQANMKRIDENFAFNVCSYTSNPYIFEDACFNRMAEVYEVPGVMAAHWLLSCSCIEEVGGFSPTFPHYGEDDNYANRVLFHGLKVGIVPDALAVHDRENRKETKEKKMYMGYIGCLVVLSTIYNRTSYLSIKILMSISRQMFVYKSFKPMWSLFCIIREIPKIVRNRKISKAKRAFLN